MMDFGWPTLHRRPFARIASDGRIMPDSKLIKLTYIVYIYNLFNYIYILHIHLLILDIVCGGDTWQENTPDTLNMFQHEGIILQFSVKHKICRWRSRHLQRKSLNECCNLSIWKWPAKGKISWCFPILPVVFHMSPFCFPELDLVIGDWWRWHVAALLDPLLDLRVGTYWHISYAVCVGL